MNSEVKAILFDVGGPIDTETVSDRLIDEQIVASFRSRGVSASDEEYAKTCSWAVEVFAPKTYEAIIWKLANGDSALAGSVYTELIQTSPDRDVVRGHIELRDGIPELLEKLSRAGLLLGLAANQPSRMLESLDNAGVLKYFDYREVSDSTGLLKPDPRLLLHSCEGLGVTPEQAIMVGDRIDNDVVPARTLGMSAIRFVTGRHAAQQPRWWGEVPYVDVHSVEELDDAIQRFVEPTFLAG